jgi:hypothetical protein
MCSDWLWAGWSRDWIPVGARFSAPVHADPGAHPASCTMGIGSFPGVEGGWGVTLTPHPLLVLRSRKRVELYLYSPKGPSWPMTGWNLIYAPMECILLSLLCVIYIFLTTCNYCQNYVHNQSIYIYIYMMLRATSNPSTEVIYGAPHCQHLIFEKHHVTMWAGFEIFALLGCYLA